MKDEKRGCEKKREEPRRPRDNRDDRGDERSWHDVYVFGERRGRSEPGNDVDGAGKWRLPTRPLLGRSIHARQREVGGSQQSSLCPWESPSRRCGNPRGKFDFDFTDDTAVLIVRETSFQRTPRRVFDIFELSETKFKRLGFVVEELGELKTSFVNYSRFRMPKKGGREILFLCENIQNCSMPLNSLLISSSYWEQCCSCLASPWISKIVRLKTRAINFILFLMKKKKFNYYKRKTINISVSN